MPRQARIDAPGTLHHVISRGIERKAIVKDDYDRADNHRCGRVYPLLPAACVAKRLYADPALWSVRKPVQT